MIPLRDDVPTRSFPGMTVALIAANAAVFVYQLSLGAGNEALVAAFGVIPVEVTAGVELTPQLGVPLPLTFLSSMFLHGGVVHILGNMLFLWIFGNNVEDSMGPARFLVFYLLCGLAAEWAHIAVNSGSKMPMIGASGAISGVLAAYLLIYPHARVLTLIFIGIFITTVRIPAIFFLGFWFLLQFFSGAASLGREGGGVAWFAHVGGFIAGLLLLPFFKKRRVRLWGREPVLRQAGGGGRR